MRENVRVLTAMPHINGFGEFEQFLRLLTNQIESFRVNVEVVQNTPNSFGYDSFRVVEKKCE